MDETMALVVIEHMEEHPTRWLIAEYAVARDEAVEAGLDLVVTGVRDPAAQALLDAEGIKWRWEHSWELYDNPKSIVLDLWAERDLQPWEAATAEAFIVGGIMGDHPPRMRGILLSAMFDWASKRRLGASQMSIHTAVWAALQVRRGIGVDRLNLCEKGEFTLETPLYQVTITLPFSYPCNGEGKPIIPGRIRALLARGVLWDKETIHFRAR